MWHSIPSSVQPTQHLTLQYMYVIKSSAIQEVVLYKFHYILDLTLALRICFTAKMKAKRLLCNIVLKILGKQ